MSPKETDELSLVAPLLGRAIRRHGSAPGPETLQAKDVDVIDLDLGEPDCPTPAHIVDAAQEAASGLSPDIRISTATSEAVLAEAIRRIGDAVARVE